MAEQPQEREQQLWKLDPGVFRQREFPGMDALVAIIPKGREMPVKVKQTVDDAGGGRWFPLEGGWNGGSEDGWKVVCPYYGQDFNPDLFTILKNGWDHEHCDGCQATISEGDSCWVAKTEDGCFAICDRCHGKLKTTRK
jgi:hypothetical protein